MSKKKTFLVALILSCNLGIYAQGVSLHLRNVTVAKAMTELRKQSGYSFVYEGSDLNTSQRVNVNAIDVRQAADQILGSQNVTYTIQGKNIVVSAKDKQSQRLPQRPANKAGNRTIKGRITDANGEPIIGASVKVKGNDLGVVSDLDGNYSISANPGDALVVSYVGFKTQDVRVGQKDVVNVTITEDDKLLNEVVVVGYGTQKKVNLTGSVASVDYSKEALSRPITSTAQALEGLSAGVSVMQGSGRPGSEGFGVSIRGTGTLNNSSPLVLVDGMEMSLADVNPNDIATISVLKDAASCAIYGNRGANGVILVTTKTGTEGKVQVTYSGKFSFNSPSKLVKWVSNYGDYMEFVNEASTNLGQGLKYSQSTIDTWRAAEKDPNGTAESGYPNYVAYPNTDWMDEIYQTKLMQEHSLSINGSEKRTKYNIGLTYLDNPGMIVNTALKKYNINLNIISRITDWMEVGAHMWGYHDDQDRSDVGNLTAWSFLKSVPGIYPYYDGKYGGIETNEEDGATGNPLLNINGQGPSYYKHNRLLSTVYGQIKFLRDFTFKSQFGYEYFYQRHKYTEGNTGTYSFSRKMEVNIPSSLDQKYTYLYHSWANNWKWTSTLNWAHAFGKHDVSALVGFEEGRDFSGSEDTAKRGLLDMTITAMDGATEMRNIAGSDTEYKYRSYFGRANYAYDNRYLLELDFREDGSSRFAPGNRWGFFPSASVAWRVSEEQFARNCFLRVFDNLKFRASYGKLGNASVDNYAYQSWYDTGYTVMGGKKSPRFYLNQLPNIDITWEKTKTFDLGVDFATLGQRLTGTIDYYDKYTDGILISPSIGLTYGDKTAPKMNLAEVSNRGIEATLGWQDRAGEFTYGVSVNGTWNKNRVEKYKGAWIHGKGANPYDPSDESYYNNIGEVSSGGRQRIVEGHQINEFYLRRIYHGNGSYFNNDGSVNINGGPKDGMIRTEEDMKWLKAMVAAGYKFMGKQSIGKNGIWYGDYIMEDHNGDGVYGGSNDESFMGKSSTPKFFFGLQGHVEWRGIDFSMNWGGATGFATWWREIGQNASGIVFGLEMPKDVAYDHYFYDPENPTDARTNLTSKNPRLTLQKYDQTDSEENDFRLYSCNFLKLRNLTIGYTFPKEWMKKIYVENLRIYFSGENLWTITDFPGLDPEMRAGAGYSTMRQLSFGVNVTF